MRNFTRNIKNRKKIFLVIGVGVNTLISPKSENIKAISLKESSKVIVKNLDILENLKDEYEKIFLNYKLNKCFL